VAIAQDSYPTAPRGDSADVLHGRTIPDPYRWLEDAESAETAQWQAAQDELFQTHRAGWPHHETFRSRIQQLLATGVVGPPAWRGARRFFMRRQPDQEHAALHVADAAGERVLVDPFALDPTGTTTLDGWHPSKEGNLLAYRISQGGTEESELYILDVATGELIDGPIDRTRSSSMAWLPGEKAFYYVRRLPPEQVPDGEAQYHRRVWLHRVGTDPAGDVLVFGDGFDKTTWFGVAVSHSGDYLIVSASQGTAPRNDVWIADLSTAALDAPTLRPLQVGVDAKTAPRVGRDGRLYVFTDRDAPRGRICVTSPSTPTAEHWQTLIAERSDAVLEDYAILDGAELDRPVLLAGWTRHAVSQITVHDLATGEQIGTVPTPGVGSVGSLVEHPDGSHQAWFGYTDYATPSSIWRYDARTGGCDVWATPPGTVDDLPRIDTRQVAYESADGTTVRMFVITAAGADHTVPRPTILYGYGGFNISLTPAYTPSALSWIEAGGAWAVANLRGGGEEGEEWHRAGMRANRHRVYEDFEAAADWLVDNGWTTRDQLVIYGGSNGGLLVGAALTRRPSAYRAVLCSAPLLDMVRYEKFGLGRLWTDEYGTAEHPEQLEWLLSYSPYHHIHRETAYPAVLFTIFNGDSRTDTMHARKMAAALQHATTLDLAQAPILLRREHDVGHSQRSISRSVGLSADMLSFAAWACEARARTD
jgi:prolyl oligopeptidase